MNWLHVDVPRISSRLRRRPPVHHDDHSNLARYERAEGVLDTLILFGILVLAGFMIWGFVTSTGDQSWF